MKKKRILVYKIIISQFTEKANLFINGTKPILTNSKTRDRCHKWLKLGHSISVTSWIEHGGKGLAHG